MQPDLTTALFKVTHDDGRSYHGGRGVWKPGEWRTVSGALNPCSRGLHYCRANQLVGWLGPAIWIFEDGAPETTIDAGDKMVTSKGRVLSRLETWNKQSARLFAADCAEAVLPIFEKVLPDDDRPRKAIEVARQVARGEARAAAGAAARDAARDAQSTRLLSYLAGDLTV